MRIDATENQQSFLLSSVNSKVTPRRFSSFLVRHKILGMLSTCCTTELHTTAGLWKCFLNHSATNSNSLISKLFILIISLSLTFGSCKNCIV